MILLENLSSEPLTFPAPMRGVLKPGRRLVLNMTREQLWAVFGGEQNIAGVRVTEVSRGEGISIPYFRIPLMTVRAYDCNDTLSLDLVQAGHGAGLYDVRLALDVRVFSPMGGLVYPVAYFSNGGSRVVGMQALSFGPETQGENAQVSASCQVVSDGNTAIRLLLDFGKPEGAEALVDVHGAGFRVG